MSNESKVIWSAAALKLGGIWCKLTHDSPAWPIHGQYRCRVCGRHYPVPWSDALLAAGGVTGSRAPLKGRTSSELVAEMAVGARVVKSISNIPISYHWQ
jgi:hypothetical protein